MCSAAQPMESEGWGACSGKEMELKQKTNEMKKNNDQSQTRRLNPVEKRRQKSLWYEIKIGEKNYGD